MSIGYYLKYLFEKVPVARWPKDKDFLASMMPWSAAYMEYEKARKQSDLLLYQDMFPEPDSITSFHLGAFDRR